MLITSQKTCASATVNGSRGILGWLHSNRHGLCRLTDYAQGNGPEPCGHQHPQGLHHLYLHLVGRVRICATSEVLWLVGAIAAIGNVAGGMVGARLTLSHGEQLIRRVLTIAIIAMIIKLLFFS